MSSLHPISGARVQDAAHRDPHFFAYTTDGVLSSWCLDSLGVMWSGTELEHPHLPQEGGVWEPALPEGAGNPQGLGQGVQLTVNTRWKALGFWGFITEGIYKGAY